VYSGVRRNSSAKAMRATQVLPQSSLLLARNLRTKSKAVDKENVPNLTKMELVKKCGALPMDISLPNPQVQRCSSPSLRCVPEHLKIDC
jgi:hypothetical protein